MTNTDDCVGPIRGDNLAKLRGYCIPDCGSPSSLIVESARHSGDVPEYRGCPRGSMGPRGLSGPDEALTKRKIDLMCAYCGKQ